MVTIVDLSQQEERVMLDFDVGLQETRRAPNSPKRKAVRLKRKKGRISATRTSAGSGLGHRTISLLPQARTSRRQCRFVPASLHT
jgi:hypothetical protein